MIPYREVLKGVGGLFLTTGKATCCRRNYGRKILPVVSPVINKKKMRDQDIKDIKEAKSEMRIKIREELDRSDEPLEPDLNSLGGAMDDYQMDYKKLDQKIHQQKMFRKHFREFTEKEVSVLTWAEKEKIRFLQASDPKEWTPEALASVFPVSPEGAQKLMKSTFRAKSLKEIETHDLNVADRIKRIKSGEIPMNPDLEEKMKMRDQIPLNLGAIGPNDEKLLIKSQLPKVIGEFARLVTRVKPELSPSTTNDMFMTMPAAISSLSDPEAGDSFMLKDKFAASQEMTKLKINSKQRMTLTQFESKIRQTSIEDSSHSKEIEYLKNFEDKAEVKPVSLSELGVSEETTRPPALEDYLNYHSIPKYKPKPSTEKKVELRVENSEAYVYDRDIIGYQKPFGNRQSNFQDADHIDIPQDLREPGTVYKRGESYYDENGEFMYRVV